MRCPHCMELTSLDICPNCHGNTHECNHENSLPIGTVLNERYYVGMQISHGVQGTNYNGYDLQDERNVVIKEFFPQSLSMRMGDGSVFVADKNLVAFKSLLYDYTDMLKNISDVGSDKLVKVYDIVFENGTGYGIIECCNMLTLTEYLRNNGGSLSVFEAKKIILQLCGALASVHELGFIHGDISPQNIQLDELGNLKLMGFSTISLRLLNVSLESKVYTSFAAPEQLDSNQWEGSWTDVYSLGALFYLMIKGTEIPLAKDRLEMDTYISLSVGDYAVPQNIADTIDRALLIDPSKRISSIEEFSASVLQTQTGNTAVFSVKANETLVMDERTKVIGVAVSAPSLPKTEIKANNKKLANKKTVSKKKKFAFGFIVLLSVIVIAFLAFNFSENKKPPRIPLPEANYVPSLEGRYVDSITGNDDWNTKFEIVVRYQYNEELPYGIVIKQSPKADVKMINRGIVIITVSNGSRKVPMPNLIGSPVDFALRTLAEKEIQFFVTESDEYPDGIVGRTSFNPDEPVNKVSDKVEVFIGMRDVDASSSSDVSSSSSSSYFDD